MVFSVLQEKVLFTGLYSSLRVSKLTSFFLTLTIVHEKANCTLSYH